MSEELLGPAVVIGAAIAASTAILAIAVWAIGRAEARWERQWEQQQRDRMLARHYGRDELP